MSAELRIAYILQIHKNPEQVNKFIEQLSAEQNADVYVHIDRRHYDQLKNKIVNHSNVTVLNQSLICEWGDFSQVETTLLLLREVLSTQKHYDFVCLKSGQDLLVREGFHDFLAMNKGKIFMNFLDITWKNKGVILLNWPKVTRHRYKPSHPFRMYRRTIKFLYDKGIKIFPNTNYWQGDFELYCGSQWFTISFEAAQYITRFIDENDWFYRYFEKTYTPDEWFFHTLLMNSPFKSQIVNNNHVFLKKGTTIRDRNSPVCLTEADISIIEKSQQFFARKFDEAIDNKVIDYYVNKICGAISKSNFNHEN
ncbi:beta-1,6-N-acetylglucosaminyltransferase [Bacillus sp. FJAT-49736]|uniref:beta-1,6-N-acetylglucosaminyltransferase n=1 Tax=Bacillus sp. FJAT-49736 TaxID=2833582 RepID=UPI001BC91F31|nr:beta-1,6-N-acetylglucosaminyltransferase [Bacillus sp. FJAT-49736]MBS4172944.1 hypothetical protein [Bacillus sp. FJAT-49736]